MYIKERTKKPQSAVNEGCRSCCIARGWGVPETACDRLAVVLVTARRRIGRNVRSSVIMLRAVFCCWWLVIDEAFLFFFFFFF